MNNKRSFISALVASAFYLAATTAQGQVTNPDFEIDPPPLSGWTVQGSVSRQANGTNHAALSLEADSGGLSRIFQTVTIPTGTEWLSFRYRLFTGPTGDPSRPPDSFTAFLVDSNGLRLAVPTTSAPTFTDGFLYEDSDGVLSYATGLVDRVDIVDGEGLHRVAMNVSSVAGVSARLEFGFANFDNGVNSYAVVDDILLGCPPGYCCDPITGTIEKCDPLDVVFLLDTSGSMNDEGNELCNQINLLVSTLLDGNIEINYRILAIAPIQFTDLPSCLGSMDESVEAMFPPGHLPPLFLVPDYTADPGLQCGLVLSGEELPYPNERDENWGPAVAMVAEYYSWIPGSRRIIVPISDEGPCLGSNNSGCNDNPNVPDHDDLDSIENAIAAANANGVIVSPIIAQGASQCEKDLGLTLATSTLGTYRESSSAATLFDDVETICTNACSGTDCAILP